MTTLNRSLLSVLFLLFSVLALSTTASAAADFFADVKVHSYDIYDPAQDVVFDITFGNKGTSGDYTSIFVDFGDGYSKNYLIDFEVMPGQTLPLHFTHRYAKTGTFSVKVSIDPSNLISETDEGDNQVIKQVQFLQRTYTYTVSPSPQKVSYAIGTDITANPVDKTISFTIQNKGNQDLILSLDKHSVISSTDGRLVDISYDTNVRVSPASQGTLSYTLKGLTSAKKGVYKKTLVFRNQQGDSTSVELEVVIAEPNTYTFSVLDVPVHTVQADQTVKTQLITLDVENTGNQQAIFGLNTIHSISTTDAKTLPVAMIAQETSVSPLKKGQLIFRIDGITADKKGTYTADLVITNLADPNKVSVTKQITLVVEEIIAPRYTFDVTVENDTFEIGRDLSATPKDITKTVSVTNTGNRQMTVSLVVPAEIRSQDADRIGIISAPVILEAGETKSLSLVLRNVAATFKDYSGELTFSNLQGITVRKGYGLRQSISNDTLNLIKTDVAAHTRVSKNASAAEIKFSFNNPTEIDAKIRYAKITQTSGTDLFTLGLPSDVLLLSPGTGVDHYLSLQNFSRASPGNYTFEVELDVLGSSRKLPFTVEIVSGAAGNNSGSNNTGNNSGSHNESFDVLVSPVFFDISAEATQSYTATVVFSVVNKANESLMLNMSVPATVTGSSQKALQVALAQTQITIPAQTTQNVSVTIKDITADKAGNYSIPVTVSSSQKNVTASVLFSVMKKNAVLQITESSLTYPKKEREERVSGQISVRNTGDSVLHHVSVSSLGGYALSATSFDLAVGEEKNITYEKNVSKTADAGNYYEPIRFAHPSFASAYTYVVTYSVPSKLDFGTIKYTIDEEKKKTLSQTIDAKPKSRITLSVELKNLYPRSGSSDDRINMEDIELSIDAGDEIDADVVEVKDDLEAGKDITIDLELDELAADIKEETYQFNLTARAVDSEGIAHKVSKEISVKVKKDRHSISLDKVIMLSDRILEGEFPTQIDLIVDNLCNLGSSDEELTLTFSSSLLGIDEEESLTLEENEKCSRETYSFDLSSAPVGQHTLTVTVSAKNVDTIRKTVIFEVLGNPDTEFGGTVLERSGNTVDQSSKTTVTNATDGVKKDEIIQESFFDPQIALIGLLFGAIIVVFGFIALMVTRMVRGY